VVEKHRRSMTKAVIYRGGSVALLGTLSYIATRSIETMSFITILYQVVSVIGYYVYERCWGRIKWGTK